MRAHGDEGCASDERRGPSAAVAVNQSKWRLITKRGVGGQGVHERKSGQEAVERDEGREEG